VPIDLASVNWLYVIVLAVFVFVASLIGHLVAFGSRGMGAILSAILFAAMFVGWSYYPHHVPLPTRLEAEPAAASKPAAQAPAAPARPANPVTTISPPSNPVTTITPPPAEPKQ
jgi:hypothetical protein